MDQIAALAGVSKPMLYTYFGSKEGLYVAYIHRTGRGLLERLKGAAQREDPPVASMRLRVREFLSFVEEHRDGWTVLFGEVTSNRPLADEVAELRSQIAEAVRRMLEASVAPRPGLSYSASDALAHAIVGAGESLANWWLEHPEVSRDDVADWYLGVVQAAVAAALGCRYDDRS
jgi:AcrR family transcriptional regulator